MNYPSSLNTLNKMDSNILLFMDFTPQKYINYFNNNYKFFY